MKIDENGIIQLKKCTPEEREVKIIQQIAEHVNTQRKLKNAIKAMKLAQEQLTKVHGISIWCLDKAIQEL